MSHIVTSAHPAISELCQALGLKDVIKLVLTFEINKAVVVEATTAMRVEEIEAVTPILKRFKHTEDVCK